MKERKIPVKIDVDAMDKILDSLREANADKEMWDKLSDTSLEEKGFNGYYPKKDD